MDEHTNKDTISCRICNGLLIFMEIILVIFKSWYYIFETLYSLVFPPELADVSKETVLVTGSAHGMGKGVAMKYAQLGARVVCCDVNAKGNLQVVEEIKAQGGKAFHFSCDLTKRDEIKNLADAVKREVGIITILVNNAGIMPTRPLLEQSDEEILATFDLNVLANLWLIREFLPDMIENNHGHIVAMSSCAGMFGLRNLVPYCGTKFAVRGIMESLFTEIRKEYPNSNIKLTTIYPYMVDTGLCKNPFMRFPKISKLVKVEEAVEAIVTTQRRGITEESIPKHWFYLDRYFRTLPRKVAISFSNFMSCGVNSDKES